MARRGVAQVVPPKAFTRKKRTRQVNLSDSGSDRDDAHRKPKNVAVRRNAPVISIKKVEEAKWSDMPNDEVNTIDNMPGEKKLDRTGNQSITALWYADKNAKPTPGPFGVKQSDIRLRFGEEIHELETMPRNSPLRSVYKPSGRVTMIKLLLDDSEYAQDAKEELRETLETLKAAGHIKHDYDVLFDVVREILRAAQDRLRYVGMKDDSDIEVTFCVPVCWKPSAINVMCAAFESAMKDLHFGTDGELPCQLFIVHEAEAQAMHALRKCLSDTTRGDSLIFIDCGGGTTDAGTYTIAMTRPLRLGNEVQGAFGVMVGAGDLNARFRKYVRNLLRHERYFKDLAIAIESDVMLDFESTKKRIFRYHGERLEIWFALRGLRSSATQEQIMEDGFWLPWKDMWEIFRPVVTTISEMMLDQIARAQEAGHDIDKVVIVGGFGDSRCLREYLTEELDRYNKTSREPAVSLCFTAINASATGVATGAILRAMDKANGPSRITSQSMGMLRHIPTNDRDTYSHAVYKQPSEIDDEDGQRYIWDTIEWKVVKGDRVNAVHDLSYIATHSFRKDQPWIIEEILYASESCHESFFQTTHVKNAGKVTEIGRVEFDIRHMKQRIQQTSRKHDMWEDSVEIMVEVRIIDRNIEFNARWPATSAGQVIQGSRKFFSVASAFVPGTQ